MNINDLEQRTNSQAGIIIIESCLRQIRSYNNFEDRKRIIGDFIKKEYPKIREIDRIAIKQRISTHLKDYEFDYKGLEERPSTVFEHPFVLEIDEEVILRILESIKSDIGGYIGDLSQLYPEYSS